jgi:blue copper oxidase
MQNINSSRRRFFQQSGLGLLSYAALPGWVQAMQQTGEMPRIPANRASANFHAEVEIDLFARNDEVAILQGAATRVLRYAARLVKGPAHTVTELSGSFLGPIVRLEKGQKVRINLHNQLSDPHITHWHGLHVPERMDGHPKYTIDSGQTYVYEFEVLNRASMNIIHPHTHNLTGSQVYYGLAGAIIVNDQEEQALQLPSGEYEIPLVIQDKSFDAQNQLRYAQHMRDRMMGFYGDRILVNGKPDAQFNVSSRAYRLRVMNGSTARIYKLAWDDGSPITVIGTDGGLLETPVHKPYVMLAPGERLDLWADFSGRKVGSKLTLRSREFSGVLPKMAERMGGMHAGSMPLGSDYAILTINITRSVSDSPALPKLLSKFKRYSLDDVANPRQAVPIAISEGPMRMVLNGRPYAFDDVQASERIKLGTMQLLEIFHAHGGEGGHGESSSAGGMKHGASSSGSGEHGGMGMGMMKQRAGRGANDVGEEQGHSGGMMNHGGGMGMMGGGGMGMMMSMAHPIHLHGQAFQIVSRSLSGSENDGYASVKDGFVDSGFKDTVLVMPGEKLRIIKPFEDFKGRFLFHCHNLEHEDMGMMREFSVE